MRFSTAFLAAALSAHSVLAGLEDAQYSTVLTPSNFDSQIGAQSEGTLVAFFAPWCGHCKSLEPVWTKVAKAFEGDDRCKVAHLNADDAAAKPLAAKYGVSGYPTLKFIHPASKGGAVEDYRGPRTEDALLDFLNEHCGTHKLPGGLLGDLAGRIPSLDSLAALYLSPTATVTRPDLRASASAIASSLQDSSSSLVSYYNKLFDKFGDLETPESIQEARAWIEKEYERLGKIAGKKGSVAVKKIEEARMKQNILSAFAAASASASSLSSVASATASFLGSVASESASSLSSVASNTASSLSSVASKTASSAASVVSASASSAGSVVSASAESIYDAAASPVSSAGSVASASASSAASSLSKSASSAVSAASKSASSLSSAASKSASSAASAANASGSSAASAVSGGVGEAQKSAQSVASEASRTASGVTEQVKETAAKVTDRVREEL